MILDFPAVIRGLLCIEQMDESLTVDRRGRARGTDPKPGESTTRRLGRAGRGSSGADAPSWGPRLFSCAASRPAGIEAMQERMHLPGAPGQIQQDVVEIAGGRVAQRVLPCQLVPVALHRQFDQ